MASGETSGRQTKGTLYVVATPIGNLEDITLRALRILREVDAICAEDTRRTRILCQHHGVATPLRSLHAHTPERRIRELAVELSEGARLAVVTDAGTPLVSDPGAALVRAAIELEVPVVPIPGPSAPIAALVASGLAAGSFAFFGFLPRGGRRRAEGLEAIARFEGASVLFESPSRLGETLRDLGAVLGGERGAAVCRELTKLHEEAARGTLDQLIARFPAGARGEITIVIGAPERGLERAEVEVDDAEIVRWIEDEGLHTREAAERLASLTGMKKKDAYRRVLETTGDRVEDTDA